MSSLILLLQCVNLYTASWSQPIFTLKPLSAGTFSRALLHPMAHLFPMSKHSVYHSSKSIPQLHFYPQLLLYFFAPQIITTTQTCVYSVSSLSLVTWVHSIQTVLPSTPGNCSCDSSVPSFLPLQPSFPPSPHAHIKKLILILDLSWPSSIIWPRGSWFYSWSFCFLHYRSFLVLYQLH